MGKCFHLNNLNCSDSCFKCSLSSSLPLPHLLTLPKSTAICILFATTYICPHFPLKNRSQLLRWCRLAENFDCNQRNAHLFQLSIWPQDFQCLSCNRGRIRPGHYMFGKHPRHFQVLQKVVPAILWFVRFFPPLNQTRLISTMGTMPRDLIQKAYSFD